jgi:DNA-binding GntR family transcriptional regulator
MKSVKRVQLDAIHDELRDRICLLHYPPGTVLREGELAAEFGISRTPIREILQRLAFAGLVEARNGVGTIVTAFDFAELKDIYEMRIKVAELIGQLSPRGCKPAHIRAVEALLDRARRLRDDFDIREYWRINHEMHFIVSDLIGNTALRKMWDHFYFQVARIWYGVARNKSGEVAESLCRELEDVLRAMALNDVAAIGFIQRNYIASGLRHVQVHYEA